MSGSSASESKPNLLTYQLLFKNVRSTVRNHEEEKLFKPDDLERVIQLFFQLNAN